MTEEFKELSNIFSSVKSSTHPSDYKKIEEFALKYKGLDEEYFITAYLDVDRIEGLGMDRKHIENIAKNLYDYYKELNQ